MVSQEPLGPSQRKPYASSNEIQGIEAWNLGAIKSAKTELDELLSGCGTFGPYERLLIVYFAL
jgi:hypothetical protein